MKKIAIVQSSYIPWKGYFDLIRQVDEFILLDDVQYTKRDWRSRNQIKTKEGLKWLTIPVDTKGKFEQRIMDCFVADSDWRESHWKAISINYSKAPCFREYSPTIKDLYLKHDERRLSEINYSFIKAITDILGIKTTLSWSTDYASTGTKTDRLVSLCRSAKASSYLSGPSAKDYIEKEKFLAAGIELNYIDYSNYPVYSQLHGSFEHKVSVLDLIFNIGESSLQFIKGNQ